MTIRLTPEMLDELLDAMRPYFDQEHEWLSRTALCETDEDLIARQRYAALLEARETLRLRVQALLGADALKAEQ